ncbi:uncharacterized protein LOC124277902 [Haliotis rubra]|uniref:uncharacterized protein LOC124277902 n=1 Tax=Haliotis rubra TaxID=36100 RepID=UPI001EE5DBCC|nr:uncharacterized protein LOC124277902 [Haliotis rubra]
MDLGSHVGAFSLSVAVFGRKVVSVDPLIENVQRLCKSIQKGGFTDRMTIIFNPLGANHSLVNFKRIPDNLGGTSVVASSTSSFTSPCDEPSDSYTITLDDILPYLPFKKAVLKMDIQEFEYYVLHGAGSFFKEIEVSVILMEWQLMKTDISGENLVELLSSWKYSAYEPIIGGKKLDPTHFRSWPYDVLWKKAKLDQLVNQWKGIGFWTINEGWFRSDIRSETRSDIRPASQTSPPYCPRPRSGQGTHNVCTSAC